MMSEKICNDGLSDVNNMLQNLSLENKKDVLVCANCGKEGNEINNTCNKCKQVKYCDAACKKKHRHKHKKECEEHIRLAAKRAAELHDKEIFKEPPPAEDCPICFLLLPTLDTGRVYMACCGKRICSGCIHAPIYDNQGNEIDEKKCPFCRTPAASSDKENMERMFKRMEANDASAMYNLGVDYRDGNFGLPQDYRKALELWHRAAKLGYADAYCNIGYAYECGEGVKVDKKKAVYYCELAAIMGCINARYNLGIEEENAGNVERARKHYMIAIQGGKSDCLSEIKELYLNGHVTKEDYMKALQAYQTYLGKIKSVQRDKAAACSYRSRYY